MAKNKTEETEQSVLDFIHGLKDDLKKADSLRLIELFVKTTGFEPKLWGPSIVGFGSYAYTYESGHSGTAPLVAFSPRANALTVYFSVQFPQRTELLEQLGKYKSEKGCVYIKKLSDVNIEILTRLIINQLEHTKSLYPD